ncbi:MAG TPA: YidC/Oxa1 family membrane protein insertase [Candidatus Tyrphobacter sp.]
MHFLLAAFALGHWLDPFVGFIWWIVQHIDMVVHNLGWSLIILAALIRGAFWGLNVKQFKAMLAMQRIAPKLKKIQERYKGDQQRIQQETMALYREAGVNPLAGCLPLIVQLPVLYSVFYVVMQHKALFDTEHFAWIGSVLSAHWPQIFAPSLALPDIALIVLYAGSMYFSVRYGSVPSTDPQQAQMQRMMALISPLMLGFFGWRYRWPSAMVLYWLSYNVFTMGQQIYMLRRYHQPLSVLDSEHVVTEDVPAKGAPAALPARGDAAAKSAAANPVEPGNDEQDAAVGGQRRRRRKRKRKR